MANDLPFSVREAGRSVRNDEDSTRFAQLKPVCVELLGLISPSQGRTHEQDEKVHSLLKKLQRILASFDSINTPRRPLTPSLINYIFFPLGQLLRGKVAGKATGLADRIQQSLFDVLTLLATDWWRIWSDEVALPIAPDAKQRKEHWKVWEQLLILGAVALDGSYFGRVHEEGKSSSEETKLSICLFLYELLLPRRTGAALKVQETAPANNADWEWDGEEELPSMDQYDELENHQSTTSKPSKDHQAQMYPSASHLEYIFEDKTSRGAIAHAISSVLTLATIEAIHSPARVAALKVARIITTCWLGGKIMTTDSPATLGRNVEEEHRRDTKVRDVQLFSPLKQADRVASYLPGYVSSMVRILTSKRGKSSSLVTSQALLCLSSILDICLCDEANARILSATARLAADANSAEQKSLPQSLEDLVQKTKVVKLDRPILDEKPSIVENDSETSDSVKQGRTKEWLDNTISHVAIALHSIQSLTRNDSSEVQLAMLDLAKQLLSRCSALLEHQRQAIATESTDLDVQLDAVRLLLNYVLDLAGAKANSKIVSDTATATLHSLLSSRLSWNGVLVDAITEEMQGILMDLPRLLQSQKDEVVETAMARVSFILRFATSSDDALDSFASRITHLAMGASKSDSWGVRLLWSMKMDDGSSIERGADSIILDGFTLRTSQSFLQVFEEIGRASARLMQMQCRRKTGEENNSPFHMVLAFMDLASRHRTTALASTSAVTRHSRMFSQNALIVTERIMQGVAFVLDDAKLAVQTNKAGKRLRKEAHLLAKGMISSVSKIWEEDEEDLLEHDLHERGGDSVSKEVQRFVSGETGEVNLIERKRGTDVESERQTGAPAMLGPALRLDFVGPARIEEKGAIKTKEMSAMQLQREAHSQIDHSDALLLGILTSSAGILGPSVLPLLLKILYPIICGIASQSQQIRRAAAQAMDELARSAGYASVQACISSHADYVLGTASHRLISTLGAELLAVAEVDRAADVHLPLVCAQSAPLVLIEVIRMLGGESLTLVQDAIDEVLDAIDRHHQQPRLCDDLLSVLDRLIDVMVSDERLKEGRQGVASGALTGWGMKDAGAFAFQPDIERDMSELETWWSKRVAVARDGLEETVNATSILDAMDDGPAGDVDKEDDEEVAKASPAQDVVVSILEKAIPFLSHASATIRIRCLRLINRGVELLCLQGRTVEPLQVINTAWPLIMSRLGFSLSVSLRRFDKVEVPAIEELSEREFLVCIEAASLVKTLSKHLVIYLGSEKMLRQAVPRLMLLLKIVERAEGRGKEERSSRQRSTILLSTAASNGASKKTEAVDVTRGFTAIQPYTPLFTMATVVLTCLDTLVRAMGPQISETELYAFATHPTLLTCLDHRQEGVLRKAASRYYHSTLTERNKDLVWLALSGAKDKQSIFPAFLHRPELQLA